MTPLEIGPFRLQILSMLHEYEVFVNILKKKLQKASPLEIMKISRKIDDYNKEFLSQLSSYVDGAYLEISDWKKKKDEKKIEEIRKFLKT